MNYINEIKNCAKDYANNGLSKILLLLMFLLVIINPVFALQDLIALQGSAKDLGIPVTTGNISVYIYDQPSGGTLVYNQTYANAIVNGYFDIVLGQPTDMTLDYGKIYYLDMKINNQDLNFSGTDRKAFESTNGFIGGPYIKSGSINSTHIADDSILNVDISSSAAIDKSKISSTGTWTQSEIPSLTSAWAGTIDFSRIVNGSMLNVNNSNYLQGYTATNFLNNDSSLSSRIDAINSSKGTVGSCPSGQIVQNLTSTGIQCVLDQTGPGTQNIFNQVLNTTNDVQFRNITASNISAAGIYASNIFALINWSYVLNVPTFLLASDQRFNDTAAIANKLDITDQRYNDTAAVNLKLDASDQRYNDSARIDSLNSTKLNAADQRYNDTAAVNLKLDASDQRYNETSAVNAKATPASCTPGHVVQNTTTGGVNCVDASGISPVGNSGAIQFNNNSVMTGSTGAIITNEGFINLQNSTNNPSTPTSGATLFIETIGNYSYAGIMTTGGRPIYFQPSIRDDDTSWCVPPHSVAGGTAMQCNGMTTAAVVGTLTNPAPSSLNFFTQLTRSVLNSTAVANNGAEYKGAQLNWWRGNSPTTGGFIFAWKGAWSLITGNGRGCVGMFGTVAALVLTADCSNASNSVYVGFSATNTTLQICSNDAIGNATCPVNCGANFPAGTAGMTAVYLVNIYTQKNGTGYWVNVQRQDSAVPDCNAFLTTDIPVNTQFLTWHVFCNNGGTAAACTIDTTKVYVGKDN